MFTCTNASKVGTHAVVITVSREGAAPIAVAIAAVVTRTGPGA